MVFENDAFLSFIIWLIETEPQKTSKRLWILFSCKIYKTFLTMQQCRLFVKYIHIYNTNITHFWFDIIGVLYGKRFVHLLFFLCGRWQFIYRLTSTYIIDAYLFDIWIVKWSNRLSHTTRMLHCATQKEKKNEEEN